MDAIRDADYAQLLAAEIEALDAKIKELQPDWDVPSLKRSYTEAEVCSALLNLYDAA